MIYGIRTSLQVGLIAGVFATVIGLVIGLASGYIGGMIDNLLTAITNIFIVIPSFVILILISVSIDSRAARLLRRLSLALPAGLDGQGRTCADILAAKPGSRKYRENIRLQHAAHYHLGDIAVHRFLCCHGVCAADGIRYSVRGFHLDAGLGPYNTISLGIIMNWALVFEAPVAGAWWAFIPAAISIAIITFSLYMMNTGMDEIFNPKIRS